MDALITLGFRTKTAKAIAVAFRHGERAEIVRRWTVELFDRQTPETGEPHHEVLELPWPEALVAVHPLEEKIHCVAARGVQSILDELQTSALTVRAIGVTGSPDRALERIGNRHIRAHAAEGILFRHAIEVAAERCGVACHAYSDRGLEAFAARRLHCTPEEVKGHLTALGKTAGRPWRADERAAATAAWLAGVAPS